jgi:hypothetical protein
VNPSDVKLVTDAFAAARRDGLASPAVEDLCSRAVYRVGPSAFPLPRESMMGHLRYLARSGLVSVTRGRPQRYSYTGWGFPAPAPEYLLMPRLGNGGTWQYWVDTPYCTGRGNRRLSLHLRPDGVLVGGGGLFHDVGRVEADALVAQARAAGFSADWRMLPGCGLYSGEIRAPYARMVPLTEFLVRLDKGKGY